MRPGPAQPKRSDYASFDDYFDAMIEYHLKRSSNNPQIPPTPIAFIQPFDLIKPDAHELASGVKACGAAAQLPGMKQAWHRQLQQFVQSHRQ